MTIPVFKNVKCITILFLTILFLTRCSNQSKNSKEVSLAGMYKLLIIEIKTLQAYGMRIVGQKGEKAILSMMD